MKIPHSELALCRQSWLLTYRSQWTSRAQAVQTGELCTRWLLVLLETSTHRRDMTTECLTETAVVCAFEPSRSRT